MTFFFFFFTKRHILSVHTNIHACARTRTRTHTHTHHKAPDLVFLLSRRSMNKTGVQRLSEKQCETCGVLADLSAAVAVCSCHNLCVWTYRITVAWMLTALSIHTPLLTCQTCTRAHKDSCAHTPRFSCHTLYSLH